MQITGFMIMDTLEALKEKGQTLDAAFLGSVYAFEEEPKPDPIRLMDDYEQVQRRIVRLQELQSDYNIRIGLDFQGEEVSLERAVKLQGVMSRLKNQWQAAAKLEPGSGKRQAYYYDDDDKTSTLTRSKDIEVAKRQVPREECTRRADGYARAVQELKKLVRSGNAQPVELDADPALFEI